MIKRRLQVVILLAFVGMAPGVDRSRAERFAFTDSLTTLPIIQFDSAKARQGQALDLIDVGYDVAASHESAASIVAVQVGNSTLHVPRQYIDAADGFQGKFGYLKIRATLPCLMPDTSVLETKYPTKGWADQIIAQLSVWDPHELTGANLLAKRIENNKSVKYLRPHPTSDAEDNMDVPGTNFHLYKDELSAQDAFSLKDSDPLFLLECWRKDTFTISQSCSSRSLINGSLLLEYRYSRVYIDQSLNESLSIDKNIHALFQSFFSSNTEVALPIKGVCK